ncbi:heparin lyase I family protein [Kribbella endophytica]
MGDHRFGRRAVLSGLAAAAAAPHLVGAARADAGTVIFRDGFETGNFGAWDAEAVEGNGSQAVVPSPTDAADKVARFVLPNDGVSFRSELGKDQFAWGRYVYELSIFLPANWVIFDRGTILAQWHGYKFSDGTSTYPPLALNAYQSSWQLDLARLTGPTTATKQQFPLGSLTDSFGRWTKWVFDITWSTPDSDGLLVITRDGTEVLRENGANNYHQQWSPHFQTGLYRSEWRPGSGLPTGGPDVVVYHRDIAVTDY